MKILSKKSLAIKGIFLVMVFVLFANWQQPLPAFAAINYQTITSGASCTTGSGSYLGCTTILNWPQPWPDANYVPVCTGVGPSRPSAKLSVLGWGQTQVTVEVANGDSGAVQFAGVNCVGTYRIVNQAGVASGPTCSTANSPYASCLTTLNWPTAWPDANYVPVCAGVRPSHPSAKLNIVSWSPTQVTVKVANGTSNGAQLDNFAGVNCIGAYNLAGQTSAIASGASCTTASSAYASCGNAVNWPAAWPDANYVPVCSGVNPNFSSAKLSIANWNTTQVSVFAANGTSTGAQLDNFAGVNCVAITSIPPPLPPAITISASPTSTIQGQATTITWSTVNPVTSCTASASPAQSDWSGAKAPSGFSVSTPIIAATITYTLTCVGPGGAGASSVNVTVNIALISVTLSASPTSLTFGQSTTLTWTSANATACTASGPGWSGGKATGGPTSESVTPPTAGLNTYILNCTGPGGSVGRTVTVDVATPAAPTLTFSAAPTTVYVSQATTLSWSASNATQCTASGLGVASPAWSGSVGINGPKNDTPTAVGTATYSLTCTGPGGSITKSAAVSVLNAPPTAGITGNGASNISVATGGTVNYAWASTGGTSWSTTYTTDSPACGNLTNGPFPAVFGNNANGALSSVIPACQAGHTYTYTYSVSGPGGATTATLIVSVGGATCNNVGNPPSQTLRITNSGGSPLNWTTLATPPPSWVTVSPATAVAAGGPLAPGAFVDIQVFVDKSTLTVSSYSGSITVSDVAGIAAPQSVPVNFTVN